MYFVTGAAGFLGGNVVNLLLDNDHEVVIVDNLAWGNKDNFFRYARHPACRAEVLDITHEPSVEAAFRKHRPSSVIHLAALHYIPLAEQHPSKTLDINVGGTEAILNAACRHGVRQFFFASSGDVYRNSGNSHRETDDLGSDNIYGRSKIQGEALIRKGAEHYPDIAFTVGRIFNLYGEGETNPHIIPEVIHQVSAGTELKLGDLSAVRDFTPVKDAARALLELLQHNGPGVSTVNIGSGKGTRVASVVEFLCEQCEFNGSVIVDERRLRKSDRAKLVADVAKLRGIIGWVPSKDIASHLRRMVCADRNNRN